MINIDDFVLGTAYVRIPESVFAMVRNGEIYLVII